EDDPDPGTGRRLEDLLAREQVAADVEREVAPPARADARLPGEVKDTVEPGEVEPAVREVDPPELERPRVLLLQGGVVVVGEAVDADDVVALAEQRLGEVRADETRRAGDDISHRGTIP